MPIPESFKDNISEPLPKSNNGIRISKAGYDALTAADNDLLFNSAWPSLQIVKVKPMEETSVTFTAVPHGLEFPPAAFVLGGTDFDNTMEGCNVDEENVYVPTGSVGFTGGGTLVIYHLDISTDVDYPYTDTLSFNTAYNPDYGIKMIKGGGDIESTDLRDYILHSRCGSPLVLAVKTEKTVNPANPGIVQYTSKLGYPTLNFGYAGVAAGTTEQNISYGNNAYRFAPQGGQTAPIAYTDGFTTYTALADSRASIVCLRSPMFATTNTVQVTY